MKPANETSHQTPPVEEAINTYPESQDIKDILHKELDMIQAIITRMASNSFQCKGWLIGIFAFVMAINKDSNLIGPWIIVLTIPAILFWYLDGFFLYVEQRYRDLYAYTVKKRTDAHYKKSTPADDDEKRAKESMYDLRFTLFEHKDLIDRSIWAHWRAYRKRKTLINSPTLKLYSGDKPVFNIVSVMMSKTLKPFYLTILGFIFFITVFSFGKQYFSGKENITKEPITIQLDSISLQQLKNYPPPVIQVTVEMPETKSDTFPNGQKGKPGN